ncbi:type IV pilus assembly protein PilM [Kiritimatiella glycovorans]|uniref:Type IV pilus assembly protein PilM n=1 Tax=Kiritimatiella glycovorans TaxID=1307763 RepID=A0A0G3EMV7_9BACT|nr:type IV pilus assembly protein PilM [Kiritimatiella glycovorans]AKJ65454.1 Type IV pilus assembly protein PilM [Kiritimatiella glycovorans]
MMKSKRILAVDIGAASVKLAEFIRSGEGGIRLHRFGMAPIDPGAGEEANRELQITRTLKSLMSEHRIAAGTAVVSVAGQSVFSRFVSCPPVEQDKIQQIVQYEAVQNVPFPIDEVVWDYQLVERGEEDVRVMLAAIKADMVEGISSAVEQAGLDPDVLDVAPMALYNAARYNYGLPEESTLVIDIGARSTDLVFMEADRAFIRSVPVAGHTITQQIARELEVENAEAEQLKLAHAKLGGTQESSGDEQAAKVRQCVQNTANRLHMEINRSINFYRTQQNGNPPKRIMLAGGTARIEGLAEFLGQKLGVPVENLDALKAVEVDSGIDSAQLESDRGALNELVGLALRKVQPCPLEINLMPARLVREKTFRRKEPALVAALALLVLTVAAWGYYFSTTASLNQQALEGVSDRVRHLEQIEKKLELQERQAEVLKRYQSRLLGLVGRRDTWMNVMNRLVSAIPEGMYVFKTESMFADSEQQAQAGGRSRMRGMPQPQNGGGGLMDHRQLTGVRISGFGYLDKVDENSVTEFWNRLKAMEPFGEGTKIVKQPLPGTFAQEYVIEIAFKEPFEL